MSTCTTLKSLLVVYFQCCLVKTNNEHYHSTISPNSESTTTSSIFIHDNFTASGAYTTYLIDFTIFMMDCVYPQLTVNYKPSTIYSVSVYGDNQYIDSCSSSTTNSNCNETVMCMDNEHTTFLISNNSTYRIKLKVFVTDISCGSYFTSNVTLICAPVKTQYTYFWTTSLVPTIPGKIISDTIANYALVPFSIVMGIIFMCLVITISCYCYPKAQKSAIPKQSNSKAVMKNPLCAVCAISQYKNGIVKNIITDLPIISILSKSRGFDIYPEKHQTTYTKKQFFKFIEFVKNEINIAKKKNKPYDGLILFIIGLGNKDMIWPSNMDYNDIIKPSDCIKISSFKEKLQYVEIPKLIFVQTYLLENVYVNTNIQRKKSMVQKEKKEEEKYNEIVHIEDMNYEIMSPVIGKVQYKGLFHKQPRKHIDSDVFSVHNKTEISDVADNNGVFFQSLFAILDKYSSLDKSIHSILEQIQQISANNCDIKSTWFSDKSLHLSCRKNEFDVFFDKYYSNIIQYKKENVICILCLIDVKLSQIDSESLTTIKTLEYFRQLEYFLRKLDIVCNYTVVSQHDAIQQITSILNHHRTDQHSNKIIMLFFCGYMTMVNQQRLKNELDSYQNVDQYVDFLIPNELIGRPTAECIGNDKIDHHNLENDYIEMKQQLVVHNNSNNILSYYVRKENKKKKTHIH
eukprot:341434_1